MLDFKEIELKRKENNISRYKLCKDSHVNNSHYYRLLKTGNCTIKTLKKLDLTLNEIIKTKNLNEKLMPKRNETKKIKKSKMNVVQYLEETDYKDLIVLKPHEVCKLFRCSLNTLKRRIRKGIYPKPMGKNLRLGFYSKDIYEYLNKGETKKKPEPKSLGWV